MVETLRSGISVVGGIVRVVGQVVVLLWDGVAELGGRLRGEETARREEGRREWIVGWAEHDEEGSWRLVGQPVSL